MDHIYIIFNDYHCRFMILINFNEYEDLLEEIMCC